ncbi:hypothetical protein P153DRAFT_368364 [Dothidotthia symphoricarpi CBS 119687]|uniref:Uncharacterized protein n=1 Tax=Dothidotthia symphoricarpi CBS 119687 TaxID=1392245 RepID=A0A6A6A9Q5_9PLEO|nr:uncharacterized protein P153DRAFT_368364 [Dothidotthia symphoricarpi CBS 119687]KAF2127814.1 hypothetical protein P153DRAFT_368364 [Dothidotthia symphoricarpi CBS 119687]
MTGISDKGPRGTVPRSHRTATPLSLGVCLLLARRGYTIALLLGLSIISTLITTK